MADITTLTQTQVPMHLVDLGNGAYAVKEIAHGAGNHFLPGDVELEVGSANAANPNNQTLPNAANKTTYITGFAVTGTGATGAITIAVTITGLTNTLTFYIAIPAGAAVGITPLIVEFSRPVPASAVNTAIVVNVPTFGAGNLAAAASARGFQR